MSGPPRQAEWGWAASGADSPEHEVGIVGAGFSGLIAALELKRAGRASFAIFERASEVGGVWRENAYPGCACDVPVHLYSIASRPNPHWTRNFAGRDEILSYLKDISLRDGLRSHIRFGFDVAEARFEEASGWWSVADREGCVVRVRMLIVAVGPHSRPKLPPLPGREFFKGTVMHSSRWDEAAQLSSGKVAVIGTGASAVQIVPSLAPLVAELLVVQRSAPWVLPRGERRLTAFEHWLFRRLPFTQRMARAMIYWVMEAIGLAFVGPRVVNRLMGAVVLLKLRREVRDPEVRATMTPRYRVGCKRLMVSDDYYPTFNRPNVHLIDQPFAELAAGGFKTADGSFHEADHIIFATGFTVADPDDFLRVVGTGGRVLADEWSRSGAQAFQGTTVAGYPNMVMLLGPNSGLSHSSALHVVESQMAYVMGYLEALGKAGEGTYMDVDPAVQESYNQSLQARLAYSVWNAGCRSWYLDRAGRNTVIFPGLTWRYRRMMRRFDSRPFRFHRVSARGVS